MKLDRNNARRVLALALTTIIAGSVAAADQKKTETAEIPFSEAEIYLELNDTDGDLGIHSSIDGGSWKLLEIENPANQTILDVMPSGSLARQGMTQLFFESSEPPFDELPPPVFFRRFPEGPYEISGVTVAGQEMESTAVLSHVLPATPGNVRVSGLPAAINCNAALPAVRTPIVITWNPVTTSHPEIGRRGPVQVIKYQVFAQLRTAPFSKFSMDLPPNQRRFVVPAELANQGRDFKFEIQGRDVNLNQTAIESCFTIR